ncbi:MAG: hypothetical protein EBT09_01530 [Actinobacteria bacterium]|nr:hypothetical protein [Actinomycetota bacterium]
MNLLRKVGTRLAGAIIVCILTIAIAAGPDAARAASASPTATPQSGTSPVRTASSTGQTVRLVYRPHTSAVMRAAGYVAARGVSPESAVNASSSNRVTPNLPDLDLRSVDVPADQVDAAIATLSGRLDVLWVERTAKVRKHEPQSTPTSIGDPVRARVLTEPNDPRFISQWGLVNSGAKSSWAVAGSINSGTPMMVAVIDTGVQLDHEDLSKRLSAQQTWGRCDSGTCIGYSGSTSATRPYDYDGHGTHVAGIIAAETDNGIGVAGVAGDRPVSIMPVQVLGPDGTGTTDGVAAGIDWAVSKGAKVINMSLGGDQDTQSVDLAIDAAYAAGVLVIVSAGNCGGYGWVNNGCGSMNEKDYPAGYADTMPNKWGMNGNGKLIPVAAIDSNNLVASFSTQQTYVASNGMSAPGVSILSTYVTAKVASGYAYDSGTSMASPHVAGAAALIWSTFPSLTREQVRTSLRSSVMVTAGASQNPSAYGAGLLNIPGALSLAQMSCACAPAVSTPTATTIKTPSASQTATATSTPQATATSSSTRASTTAPTATNTATATSTSTPARISSTPVANLSITNVRDTSFTVSWTTGEALTGAVRWWPNKGSTETTTPDKRGIFVTSTLHYVTVDNLAPSTTYRFDVVSGSAVDDFNAAHYELTTGPTLTPGSPDTVTGVVRTPLGAASGEAILILTASTNGLTSAPMSALVRTEDQGSWTASLSNLRSQDLASAHLTDGSTIVTIDVIGSGDLGAHATMNTSTARSGLSILNVTGTSTATLALRTGWNLISLPSAPRVPVTTTGLCTAISQVAGGSSSIEIDRWVSGGWEGVRCEIPVAPFTLTPGLGYFVKVATPVSILVDGVSGEQTTALASGWNLVGLPATSSLSDASAVLASIRSVSVSPGTVVEIDRWASGAWEGHISGLPVNTFATVPGTGYFVRVTSPVTWKR